MLASKRQDNNSKLHGTTSYSIFAYNRNSDFFEKLKNKTKKK